jgi:hypothetical protein
MMDYRKIEQSSKLTINVSANGEQLIFEKGTEIQISSLMPAQISIYIHAC